MTERVAPLGPLGDLPPDVLRRELHRMADWVADYRESIALRSIVPVVQPGDVTAGLSAQVPEQPDSLSQVLGDLDAVIMPGIVHWGHPAFLGYFGSTSNGPALLGEIAAAALNVSAMTWRTSPAATELETVVLRWIRELVGLPDAFTGVVYDTASVAVLHALAAAREMASPRVRAHGIAGRDDVRVQRVYASDQAHSSLEKAMIVLGLGEENVVRLPSDDAFRLDVDALRDTVQDDRRRGRQPLAVVATVGTTSSASVDPLEEVAELCAAERLWLHVDAAYGGAIGVLPEARHLMKGVERADSVVVNPHKWLFVPLDFSTLYVRKPEALRAVFALTPEYLRGDAAPGNESSAIDYMDYGIQLGRRFRALKAWMVLRSFGRSGIAARVREHCRLAGVLAGFVRAEASMEIAAPPSMSVVCFRCAPDDLSADSVDELNVAIVEAVNVSGDAYLTHTRLRGRTVMRIGFGNVLTTEEHLATAWSRVLAERDRLLDLRGGAG
ncbi:MAG: pyridoxal-dependent decarboxylase [Gemmatimonadota bacterium]|nr:pyridoxal-dependent decarboxylase [Gemmatimonadota bacterium]